MKKDQTANKRKRAQARNEYKARHQCSELSGKTGILDAHHCIINDNINHPELTCQENLIVLTREEHEYYESIGYEGKKFFWEWKCKEFGKEHMMEWYNNLDLKVKERFY